MATDIRRMSKEELDALNEDARKWRERNKPADNRLSENAFATEATNTEGIPEQMDLPL